MGDQAITKSLRRGPLRLAAATALIGFVGAGLSLLRMFLANDAFLSTVVWAEDGLLPMCFYRSSFLGCLSEPYNGYSHFWPRITSFITYQFDFSYWPLITNLLAAITAGIFTAAIFFFLHKVGRPSAEAVFCSILVIILPLTGLEYVNQIAAANIFGPFLAVLMLAMPVQSKTYYFMTGVVLLVTALTTPLAFLFLPLLIFQQWRKHLSDRWVWVTYALLCLGLFGQLVSMARSGPHRGIDLSLERVESYFVNLPLAIQSIFTGYDVGNLILDTTSSRAVTTLVGLVIFIGLASSAVIWAMRGAGLSLNTVSAAGIAIGSGLIFSLGPSILIAESLRYFLLLTSFLVVATFWWVGRASSSRVRVVGPWVLALVLTSLWLPHLAASNFRSVANPEWASELARVESVCQDSPESQVEFTFSPQWRNDPSSPSDDLFGVIFCRSLKS